MWCAPIASIVCVCVRGIPFADARKAKQAALSSRFYLSRARLLLAPNPAQVFPRPQAPTANNAEVEGRRSTDLNLSSEVEETIDETLIGGAATNSQVSLKIASRVGWRTTPGGGWCILPSEIEHPIGDSPNPTRLCTSEPSCFTSSILQVQAQAKRWSPGLVHFVAAVAYHYCLALPAAFTQPRARLLAGPSILLH